MRAFSIETDLSLSLEMSTYQEQVSRVHHRVIKTSAVMLSLYVGWVVLATIEAVDWPGQFAAFWAGMQFQYLLLFVVGPWIMGD